MNVLITGITGRIGANLAAALRQKGHNVRGLVWERDARVEKLSHLNVELQNGTITNPDDVKKAVSGMDAIYHLAGAFQGGGPFTEAEYYEINSTGTFNVLEAARNAESPIKHFILASTDAVYGSWQGRPKMIQEDQTPPKPDGWYGLSKFLSDEISMTYYRAYNLPITILRFGWCFGADEFLDFSLFRLSTLKSLYPELEPLWEGEERLVICKDKSGEFFRVQVIDVRDQVQGCVSALEKTQSMGQRIQLGGPASFGFDEAVPYLSERIGIPTITATVSGLPHNTTFDLNKAKNLIGFAPKYNVFQMIDDGMAFRAGQDINVIPTG